MPLYDYACDRCGLTFEVSRSIKDSDIPAMCPVCDIAARRVFTPPMATFTRGAAAAADRANFPSPSPARWSHHGHSHGPGTGAHTH